MRLHELTGYKNNDFYKYVQRNKTKVSDDKRLTNRDVINKNITLAKFSMYLEKQGFHILGNGHYAFVFTHPSLNYCIKIFRKDLGYQTFLRFCWNNKGNEHLPKFTGKIMNLDNGYFAVRMEKLTGLSTAQYQKFETIEVYNSTYKDEPEPELMKEQPKLYGTLHALADLCGEDLIYDLHEDNIMMRGDIFVITDPFSHDEDIGK